MKKYFTIDEAARYLTTPTRPFGRRDVLDLAMREKLHLAFWFDGELHRFRSRFGGGYDDPDEGDSEAWHVSARGYFCVPAWQIDLDSQRFLIDNAVPMEPPLWSSRAWRTGSWGYVLGAISWHDDEARHVPLRVGIDAVLVPAEDVEALSCSEVSAAAPIADGDGGSDAGQAAPPGTTSVERPGQPSTAHQDAVPCGDSSTDVPPSAVTRVEQTRMKKADVLRRLSRYKFLESAMNRNEDWAVACRVPKEKSPNLKGGWYYLEPLEAACRNRLGEATPVSGGNSGMLGILVAGDR